MFAKTFFFTTEKKQTVTVVQQSHEFKGFKKQVEEQGKSVMSCVKGRNDG